VACELLDLSVTGLRCAVPAGPVPAEGERLRAEIEVGDDRLEVQCEVARRPSEPAPGQLGLHFLDTDAQGMQAVERMLFRQPD
jgi:hypothetical protein